MGQWSGGYGDELTIEELIASKQYLARSMARSATASNKQHEDDAVQEALIAVWQMHQQNPHLTNEYTNGIMRRRVISVARGDKLTGQESRQGHASRTATLVPLDTDDGYINLLTAADLLHNVELAYHRGEIQAALLRLSDRERTYVVLRFWHGYTPAEIMAHTDLKRATMDVYWARAKTKLRAALPHLVGAVT